MIEKKKKYKLSDFRYQLPKKFIAQKPKQKRDGSKMMVLNRNEQTIKHKKFSDITDYFQKNDLLILNNTKVFPAKLYATKDRTDAKVEIFLLRELGDRLWEVLVKPARKVRIGNKLILSDSLFCDVIDNTVSGGRVVRFEFEKGNFDDILDKLGHPLCRHTLKDQPLKMTKKDIKQFMLKKEEQWLHLLQDYTLHHRFLKNLKKKA